MARPAPKVLISTGEETGVTTEILKGNGIWSLSFQGKPIQIRESIFDTSGQRYFYPRCTYNNAGHCYNLADKMNELFGTDDFDVIELHKK